MANKSTASTDDGKEHKQPTSYVKHDGQAYVGSKLYEAGQVFVTDETPGDGWEKVDLKTKAAADAADPTQHLDVPLEGLPIAALKAVAIMHKVNPTGLDKDALIAAIKAADEPAL